MQTQNNRSFRFQLVLLAIGAIAIPASGQLVNGETKLLPSDGTALDEFGSSVDLSQGIVAVGTPLDDDNGVQSGSAYLFDAYTGAQLDKLVPNDGAANNWFGYSIAIDGGTVVVGANQDGNGARAYGTAYLFDASTGAQIAQLLHNAGPSPDNFGAAIAIDNDFVVVGASRDFNNGRYSGAAWLYDAHTGSLIHKIVSMDVSLGFFGHSVAIDNGVIAVGAPAWQHSGSVFLFDAVSGTQTTEFHPGDGQEGDWFGYSTDISNGIVAVGSPFSWNDGLQTGSAYLFVASTGAQIAKLVLPELAAGARFGTSIAIDRGVVVVGAPSYSNNGVSPGSIYFFDATTGTEIGMLLAGDGAPNDFFGSSVAVEGDFVVMGSRLDDDNGDDSGSAYIFDISFDINCSAELTGDDTLDFFDVATFLTYFSIGNPIADWNADGIFDFFDVMAYLSDFSSWCL
jgi:FG-GAP repeat protein